MAKLKGKAKAAFLERMRKGRAKAARSRGRGRGAKRSKRNPNLVTITNPAKRDLQKAVDAYREFHGVDPESMFRLGKGNKVLVALGELKEVVYQPRRGHRKGPAFFHKFKPGNVLAVSSDGRELRIVDTKRRRAVKFDRGIVN